ncbi:MAG: hypothetical protein LBO05_01075, partial [Deltaproteobacteria bacterium]|nr:hypothetical protein [Deltaproteobacteria bacterium]
MSDELTAFLNFVFKKQETVTKVLEDDKVTMADRWQLNWREYERELASLGLPAADAEKRPSLLRYGIPQPSAAVLNDLLGFQAEMREVMGRISREKIVPAEFFKRLVGESKKVLASVFYVADEAEGDITPENIGSVRMSFCYDAATYDRVIAAIILELVANKTIFNLETTPEGFFYFDLPSAQPLPAPSFVPGEDFSAADVPDSPDDGDDDADFDQSPRKAFSQAEQLVQTILGSMDREAQDRSLAALFEILSMVDQKTAVGETGGEDVLTGDEEAREAGEAKAEEIAEAALETESPEASVPLLADRAPKRTEPGGGDSKSADAVPETGGGDEPKPEVPSPDAEFFPDLPPFTLEPEVKKILEDELVPEQIEIGLVDDLQDFVPDLPADPESEPGGPPGGKKAGPADEAEGQASNQANEIRGILAKIESGGPEGGTSDVLLALEEGCQEGDVVVVEGGGDGVGAKDAEETGPVGGDEGPGASANDEGPSVAHDDGLIIADGDDDDAGHGDGPDDEYFLSAPMLADAHEETSGVDAEENTGDAEPADDADSPDEVWEPATEDDDGESGMPSPPSAEAAGTSGESLFKWWPEEKAVVPLVPESPFGGAAPGFLASPKNFDDEIIEP